MDIGLGAHGITLESRFTEHDSPVLLSGVQALVRLLLEQARADRAAGLHTGGLVSGYRGSPLGGLDQELWKRETLLRAHEVRFQPGLNEDLAATMLMGSQQFDSYPGKRVDGVFGMWYGKGPGVDRSGDALHLANMVGTHHNGGVLAVAGDDHGAHSSTYPHQTDHVFEAYMIPVFAPAGADEIISLGLAGYALSRFSGVWVALKTIAETAEQSRTLTVPVARSFVVPDFPIPPHGLNADPRLRVLGGRTELERRLMEERLPAALAWARANGVDRDTVSNAEAPIGIVTVGKAHHDLEHALRLLGLAGDPRIAVRKVGMVWPLEQDGMRRFAAGRRLLLVVEEKRSFVESQIRDTLYNLPADSRPIVVGKADLNGAKLLPAVMELSPEIVATSLPALLRTFGIETKVPPILAGIERPDGLLTRAATFCAGCPHNSSTVLPEGAHAMAGIGCHVMAAETVQGTGGISQMGGEGVAWQGIAPFTATKHMFVNMGDGTYQHSGILAIRQAIAAGAPVTYKILYNDAVAMTGGQPAEGSLTPTAIAAQLAAEGVRRIAYVADDANRLPAPSALPSGTTRHVRADLQSVMTELQTVPGVSVLLYDQVCATEKRRRRKRGKMAKAEVAVTINADVCENCGDCTVQSRCIAVEPVETRHGRKRRISPTACNTDLSCLKGFCPSFVTTSGTAPVKPAAAESARLWLAREGAMGAELPEPELPHPNHPWRGLFAGIGGGGIVTTGAIVAMAAHLEGRQVTTLDFTGLAQKNGAVVSHVQIADGPLDIVRIPTGEADLMLAADLAVAASAGVLERCGAKAAVVGNLDLQSNLAFLGNRDLKIDSGLHRRVIERRADAIASRWVRAAAISERLFGTAQALNTLLLGIAWQRGLVPVGRGALLRAIELNGTAVELNRRAFLWGRLLAEQPELVDEVLTEARTAPQSLEDLTAARAAELVDYQDAKLAARYRALVNRATAVETALAGAPGRLSRNVAEGYFRALAYKDEYEVARLHAGAEYGAKPVFHLAPPLVTRVDPATGRRRKIAVPGSLVLPLFRLLRHGKRLRGTVLDPFGYQADRRMERALVAQYEADMDRALTALRPDMLDTVAALAALPMEIRGFGPVKEAAFRAAESRRATLLRRLDPRPASGSLLGADALAAD